MPPQPTEQTSLGRKTSPPSVNKYPLRSPRFWHGMRMGYWWSMLARNGFRVSPRRLHLAAGVSIFTPFNDVLGGIQALAYGRKINNTEIDRDPIFVLGHWRSGTTLMHELMVLDEQFASPSTYACFAPWHFLVSEALMVRYGSGLIPNKRPMDNMRAGWELPQEDEFALMNLGAPTPYLLIAFPNSPVPWMNFIDMRDISSSDLERWQSKFMWFLKALTFKHQKQLILKSPPHTGRLAQLNKMFPKSKYIHMVRDPRKLFASTLKLWKSLAEVQGMQVLGDDTALKQTIWDCLDRMYQAFESARASIAEENIIDVRYEDLIASPVETIAKVYKQLGLGDSSAVEALVAARFASDSEYQVNEHKIDPALEAAVMEHWGDYARRYGYV